MKVEVLRFIQEIIECVLRFSKNGVKNGVHTLLFFDKNRVPQLSLFEIKSENGVKIGVSTLLFVDKNGVPQLSLFDVKSENRVKNGVKTE